MSRGDARGNGFAHRLAPRLLVLNNDGAQSDAHSEDRG